MNPAITWLAASFPPTPLAAPQDRMPPTQSAVVNGPANGPGNFLPPLFNLSGLDLPSVFSLPPQQHHPHNMGHSSGQPQHSLGGGFNPSPHSASTASSAAVRAKPWPPSRPLMPS